MTEKPIRAIQPKRASPVMLVLSIIIAAILLFFALKGISWEEMLSTVKNANPLYLLLAFALGTLTTFLRGTRWGVLLSAQKRIPLITMFWATNVGYLGNTFLPARAGEVIRSVLLGEKAGISKSFVFATALTERILDVIELVLITLIAIPFTGGTVPNWLIRALQIMGVAGSAALLIIIFSPHILPWLKRIINRLPLKDSIKISVTTFLDEFLTGAQAFLHPGRAAGFIAISAAIWFLDAVTCVSVGKALSIAINIPQSLLQLTGMGLASAIPSTPGYVGIYQFVATTLLPLFGISKSEALTFILAFQAVTVSVITIWGFIGIWRLNLRKIL
jgi:uncharacterized protein (TIRG00374 family)